LSSVVANSLFHVLKLWGLVLLLLLVDAGDDGKVVLSTLRGGSLGGFLLKDALVIDRQDLDKARQGAVEVHEDTSRQLGSGVVVVILDQATEVGNLGRVLERASFNHLRVELVVE